LVGVNNGELKAKGPTGRAFIVDKRPLYIGLLHKGIFPTFFVLEHYFETKIRVFLTRIMQ